MKNSEIQPGCFIQINYISTSHSKKPSFFAYVLRRKNNHITAIEIHNCKDLEKTKKIVLILSENGSNIHKLIVKEKEPKKFIFVKNKLKRTRKTTSITIEKRELEPERLSEILNRIFKEHTNEIEKLKRKIAPHRSICSLLDEIRRHAFQPSN